MTGLHPVALFLSSPAGLVAHCRCRFSTKQRTGVRLSRVLSLSYCYSSIVTFWFDCCDFLALGSLNAESRMTSWSVAPVIFILNWRKVRHWTHSALEVQKTLCLICYLRTLCTICSYFSCWWFPVVVKIVVTAMKGSLLYIASTEAAFILMFIPQS